MPVQRFAPMTKDFATFDCDAHVTEPPLIWERAQEFLTRDELDALKATIWWDAESRLLIVNGRAGIGLGSPRARRHPRHHAGHHQCRPRGQARHPARPQRAQPQPEDRADPGAGGLSRPRRLLRAEAAPARHGRPGHRSGHDHPHRDRHLPLAGERARRQGLLPGLQRVGLRVHAGGPRAALLRRADPDAASGLRRRGGPPRRRPGLPRRAGPPDGCDGQLSAAAEVRAGVGRAGRDRHGLRHAPVPGLRQPQAVGLQRAVFRRRADPAHRGHRRPAALLPDQCAELPGRSGAVGDAWC